MREIAAYLAFVEITREPIALAGISPHKKGS